MVKTLNRITLYTMDNTLETHHIDPDMDKLALYRKLLGGEVFYFKGYYMLKDYIGDVNIVVTTMLGIRICGPVIMEHSND